MIRFACPRCRAILEQPDTEAVKIIACALCGQRLEIPQTSENKTVLGELKPRHPSSEDEQETVAFPPPPPPASYVTSQPETAPPSPIPFQTFNPASSDKETQSRSRRRQSDDEEYDDYPSIERRGSRRNRYFQEIAARSATSGLICSLSSLGLLLLTFVLWALLSANPMGRFGQAEPLLLVVVLIILASLVMALLGVIFSSRGLGDANIQKSGQATSGLVLGIISLVIGSLVGLFTLCAGLYGGGF